MANKVISLLLLAACDTQHALADVKYVAQLDKSMSKAFQSTGQMPRLSGSVVVNPEIFKVVTGSSFPVHEAPSSNQFSSALHTRETLKEQNQELKSKEGYQYLRPHVRKMPQKYAQNGFGFGSLMGVMASFGLVVLFGIAAVRKYFAHGGQALQSMVGFQIFPSPQRSRPIAVAGAAGNHFKLADLKDQARKLKPVVGYFDPLNLQEIESWEHLNESTIRFLRHGEIKHGRVALASLVGHMVHKSGIHWPSSFTGNMPDDFSFLGSAAPAVWDRNVFEDCFQIILTICFFELWSESTYLFELEGQKQYMLGGKPGYFAAFKELPHPVHFNLYDPFKVNVQKSDEWKPKKLFTEVNDGRLAMIGFRSFLGEAKVTSSVLFPKCMVLPHAGEVMALFQPAVMLVNPMPRRVFLSAAAAATLFSPQASPTALASPETNQRQLLLRSGDRMPLIGLGTGGIAPGEIGNAIKAALSAGCRHIDCAAVYRNEQEIGDAIKVSGVPREEIFITSKLWNDRRRPSDVRAALEKTLNDLGTDHLDLYLIHWPVVWKRDSVMAPDAGASLRETWQTLEALHDEGKVRNIGVSNYKEAELRELLSYARVKPAVNQIELHPRLPQSQLVQYCQREGIGVTAYSPLGRGSQWAVGLLNVKKAGLLTNPSVVSIADSHGVSPASVILKWNLQRGVAVIPQSVNPSRIAQNARQPFSFQLTTEETAALDRLDDGSRFCTAPWSTFDNKSASDLALSPALSVIARGIFSVAPLDITRR